MYNYVVTFLRLSPHVRERPLILRMSLPSAKNLTLAKTNVAVISALVCLPYSSNQLA